jgi:hypothetical protein
MSAASRIQQKTATPSRIGRGATPRVRYARGALLALVCATALLGCSKTETPASSASTSTAASGSGASTTAAGSSGASTTKASGGGSGANTEFCQIALQAEKDADTFDPSKDTGDYIKTFKKTISDLTNTAPDEIKGDLEKMNEAVQKFDSLEDLMGVGNNPELKEANDHLAQFTSEHCGA